MNTIIEPFFKNKDFDLRKKSLGYSRFMDQKVTPDVLSFIADCISNFPLNTSFTVRDIWESDYFKKNTPAVFGKPETSNQLAHSEYNKFIGQPLKTLAYAGILTEVKDGNTNRYKINHQKLLEYISLNQRCALDFLHQYLTKVLIDSGFYQHFENYRDQVKETANRDHFYTLKQRFQRFMTGNTNINGKTEVNRIFPKVINPLAVKEGIPGSEKGYMTRDAFQYSDLMYNRTNFRDIKKAKKLTRQEAQELAAFRPPKIHTEYMTQKAMKIIKLKYASSEVRDQWANGKATQVHHIFPRSQYPQFIACLENLIKLTPEQHYSQAHPNAHTKEINRDYQIQCLLAKCDSIERSLQAGDFFYSKERLVSMLNVGLNLELNPQASFEEIRKVLRSLQTLP